MGKDLRERTKERKKDERERAKEEGYREDFPKKQDWVKGTGLGERVQKWKEWSKWKVQVELDQNWTEVGRGYERKSTGRRI